ncbi:MAG: hypothetical protein IT348_18390 [Candidatus Eisenbacteria bacterium]|nr:hypothetical protein [Candidatus Eisenbacteria bacterium]
MRALPSLRLLAPLLIVCALAAGCAGSSARPHPLPAGQRKAVILLPLENLTGRAENGDRFSRLVWSMLARSGRFDAIDPGEVDAALGELRIRSAGSLTREQVLRVSSRLNARWIVAGTLLECGTMRTPDGDIPSFGLTLRVLDGRTGQVVWADLRARSGQDRETIFGWGREESLDRLAEATARELVNEIDIPDMTDSVSTTEGRP